MLDNISISKSSIMFPISEINISRCPNCVCIPKIKLIRKKDRTIEDYIELFSGRNCDEEEITTATNDRYKRLYNLGKINQAKAEIYRQKMKEQRDIEELAECSFAPKINKE